MWRSWGYVILLDWVLEWNPFSQVEKLQLQGYLGVGRFRSWSLYAGAKKKERDTRQCQVSSACEYSWWWLCFTLYGWRVSNYCTSAYTKVSILRIWRWSGYDICHPIDDQGWFGWSGWIAKCPLPPLLLLVHPSRSCTPGHTGWLPLEEDHSLVKSIPGAEHPC